MAVPRLDNERLRYEFRPALALEDDTLDAKDARFIEVGDTWKPSRGEVPEVSCWVLHVPMSEDVLVWRLSEKLWEGLVSIRDERERGGALSGRERDSETCIYTYIYIYIYI